MNTNAQDLGNIFGEPIAVYSRRQAIEDGVLVDVSEVITPCPFKYSVAMKRAAWAATIEAGGTWRADGDGESLTLPGGQDVKGRTWDVFNVMLATMRGGLKNAAQRRNTDSSRIYFDVLVDVHGNGRHSKVELYSVCGPGDNAEPVITIMLQGED
jgi:hypothetical protein